MFSTRPGPAPDAPPLVSEAAAETIPQRRWRRADYLALAVWTAVIVGFFWDVVALKGALFYFDITEINYPYRAFFAEELLAGRFSRWHPGLYCGLPLYSESQAGYLHPFKYLFYPWMATWKAFNLDTVFSIWLTGAGAYCWLRRRAGAAGALTGAAVLAFGGYTWAHFVHTSMINALASLPFVIWGLERAWETGRPRGAAWAGLALACQVFAGHLQDALFTIVLVLLYGLYRAATESGGAAARARTFAMAVLVASVGVLISAAQWAPSKELLDRSPRAGGLSWSELVYGSWHPELLPTLVVREAYGTRARDTDWMDGFYPYHEMNAYLGLIAMGLAVVGAGGGGRRDRWANFWVFLIGLGGVLMLGKFTFLFDHAHRMPILGGSREPVRFSLWVALGVAALAARGVDRLARPGAVSLRGAFGLAAFLIAASVPILIFVYRPVWAHPGRWTAPYHLERYRWLGRELTVGAIRAGAIAMLGAWAARSAARSSSPVRRARRAALLPLLVMADLLGAHWRDVPTVSPSYWTAEPASARALKRAPDLVRIFARGDKSAGEPGYASETINFLSVRDPLDWGLPPVWGVRSSRGNTPMISRRLEWFTRIASGHPWRFDLESDSHIVTGRRLRPMYAWLPSRPVGSAFIHENPTALPRARLVGRPVYVDDERAAAEAVSRLGPRLREQVVVEDPTRPLGPGAEASGSAEIIEDRPERVVVRVRASNPAYLVLADTFDPGWSATVDGTPAPIRPAYLAFRAVFLRPGDHEVVFNYRPAGLTEGLALSAIGAGVALALFFRPARRKPFQPDDDRLPSGWPAHWRAVWFLVLTAIVLASLFTRGPDGRIVLQSRWKHSAHPHTWGSGIEAMKENRG